jgi:protoheme IX farnesyltransferase
MLFALLLLWQLPQFMAIAWMYRDDYARAGYLVLPSGELAGNDGLAKRTPGRGIDAH